MSPLLVATPYALYLLHLLPPNLGYIVVVVPFLALLMLLLLVYLVNPVDFVLPTPTLVVPVLPIVNLLEHEGRVVVEVVEVLRVRLVLVQNEVRVDEAGLAVQGAQFRPYNHYKRHCPPRLHDQYNRV